MGYKTILTVLTTPDQGAQLEAAIALARRDVIRLAADFTPEERSDLNDVLGRLVRRDDLAPIYTQLEDAMACGADHTPTQPESEVNR